MCVLPSQSIQGFPWNVVCPCEAAQRFLACLAACSPLACHNLVLLPLQVTDVSAQLSPNSQPEKEGPLHQCLDCDRAFSSAAVLMHHSKEVHGKERIHGCRVCRKAFKRATHLKVHPGDRGQPQS